MLPTLQNSWVTLTIFLGCLSCISYVVSFVLKICLATSLSFLPQACNQGTLPGQMCKINETTNLTRNAGFLKGDTNLIKEGSFSTT